MSSDTQVYIPLFKLSVPLRSNICCNKGGWNNRRPQSIAGSWVGCLRQRRLVGQDEVCISHGSSVPGPDHETSQERYIPTRSVTGKLNCPLYPIFSLVQDLPPPGATSLSSKHKVYPYLFSKTSGNRFRAKFSSLRGELASLSKGLHFA